MFGVVAGGTPRGDYFGLECDHGGYVKVHIGSDDSIYSCSYPNNVDSRVIKHNKDGVVKWVTEVDTARIWNLESDSSGNVYFCGDTTTYGSGGYDAVIGKLSSTGSLTWLRTLGATGAQFAFDIAKDSSGNLYICGYDDPAGVKRGIIAKYNSSGTIQWQKRLSGTYDVRFNAIAIDGSDNIYVTGTDEDSGGDVGLLLVKYNTSGAVQWQKKWGTTGLLASQSITTDSSGNVYVGGRRTTGYWNLVAKFNSSGTVQWARGIDPGALLSQPLIWGLDTDSSGNVYAGGGTSLLGFYGSGILAKYNSSGTLQWQNTLSEGIVSGLAINSDDDITIGIASDGTELTPHIVQLINDGTGTGDYSTSVGGGTALTLSTSAESTATLTESTSTPSHTEANAGLTDALESATTSSVTITGRYFKGPL